MINFSRICALVIVGIMRISSQAQCTIYVAASNGSYTANLYLNPVSIIRPGICPFGYNYNTVINYDVTLTGSSPPPALNTLQGNLFCNGQANFFSLPLSGGRGNVTSSSNPFRPQTDCAMATPQLLMCTNFSIQIQGPNGINNQTVTCTVPLEERNIILNAKIVNKKIMYTATIGESSVYKNYQFEESPNLKDWTSIESKHPGKALGRDTLLFELKVNQRNKNYYRLSAQRFNGTWDYSNTLAFMPDIEAPKLKITTISSEDKVLIELDNPYIEKCEVYTMAGKKVWEANMKNLSSYELDIAGWNSGVYIVKHGSEKAKFLKI